MENNIKLLFDLLTALLLEILPNLAHMWLEVLLCRLKCQFSRNSTLYKKVYHTLILLTPKKCQSAVGKNLDILNNCMLFLMVFLISGPSTRDSLKIWIKKMLLNSCNSQKHGKVIKLMKKVLNLKLTNSTKNSSATSHCLPKHKFHLFARSGVELLRNKS